MQLTHTVIQECLVQYMEENGWYERPKAIKKVCGGISDNVFVNEVGEILHAEVKPETVEQMEIWTGIGQTLRILGVPKLKTILVCPSTYASLINSIFKTINSDRLGLLVYDSECNFIPVIDIWGDSKSSKSLDEVLKNLLVPLDNSEISRSIESLKLTEKLVDSLSELLGNNERITLTPEQIQEVPTINGLSKKDVGNRLSNVGIYSRVLSIDKKYGRYYFLTKEKLEKAKEKLGKIQASL